MVYLKRFTLLDEVEEHNALIGELQIYNGNYYPFGLFSYKELKNIDFENITIFYGGNGSGKTTLLNIIAENINAYKNNRVNKGPLFHKYANMCSAEFVRKFDCEDIKLITSDDVFDYLLDIRTINTGVNRQKSALIEGYRDGSLYHSDNLFDDYDSFRFKPKRNESKSQYIRRNLINNTIQEHSNGETALLFWQNEIKENSIYILDEPENSLSAENQLKLKEFIEESARFYNCQFIISTHSPFILSLKDALIYDLDSNPVVTKKWNHLDNVITYYKFFKDNSEYFENNAD